MDSSGLKVFLGQSRQCICPTYLPTHVPEVRTEQHDKRISDGATTSTILKVPSKEGLGVFAIP